MNTRLVICACLLSACAAGCMPIFSKKAANGITFYCPGAGNTDMGYFSVRSGLESAGYDGEVSAFIWTLTFLPLDQELRPLVRLRSLHLGDIIDSYIERYPGRPVNLVGLSAGSGVALWALESMDDGHMVDNVILLGSSLSHDYDVSKAFEHIRGKIYVYYSPHDAILAGPMKIFGTIDGKFGVDGAGSVGLKSKRFAARIVNVPWRDSYKQYGYAGGHIDATSAKFVEAILSNHIIRRSDADEIVARGRGRDPVAAWPSLSPAPPAH